MNNKHIKPITNTNCTCMKCLNEFTEDQLITLNIQELGYGSIFDGINTKIILCKDCYEKSNKDIWSFKVKEHFLSEFQEIKENMKDFVCMQEYMYEKDILNYINDLPIQAQELIWNTFSTGWNTDYKLEQQDWIDYKLNCLSKTKCDKYGLISNEEKEAYCNRFTSCEWPVNRIYKDTTIICQCPYDAYGKENQVKSSTVSKECYKCNYYKKRSTPIKNMNYDEFEKYKEEMIKKNQRGAYEKNI